MITKNKPKRKPLVTDGQKNVIMIVALILVSLYTIPIVFSELETSREKLKLTDPDRIEFIEATEKYNLKYYHESGFEISPESAYDKKYEVGIFGFCDEGYVSFREDRFLRDDKFDIKTDKETLNVFCGGD